MTRTNRLEALAVVAATALALCLLALVAVQPAEAAFPGKNGKILFWSDRSSGPGLYTTTPSSTAATKIPGTAGGDSQATWSPDGTRIVFQSTSRNSKEISVMNADGSGRQQLTSTTTIAEQEPTWSPDGTQIAFVAGTSDTDTTTDLEIWVMDADGSDLVQLTNTPQGVRDTQPAWSPDGNRFAFLSEGRAGDSNSNIYVMDANPLTNDASNLTDDDGTMTPVYQYNDEDPSWSPDGTQITYSTKADVWKMNAADGSGKVNLTVGNGGGSQPAWSPDGDSIVYVRGGDIYVMDNNGDNKTPVDTTLRKDEKPDWQQDSLPPNTTITSGPASFTRSTAASLAFVSSESDSTFQCSLDNAAFAACSSAESYSGLANGLHTFRVRATDVAGNVDLTPAARSWRVDTQKPSGSVLINNGRASTTSRTVTLKLAATDPAPASGVSHMRLKNNGSATWSRWFAYSTSKTWALSAGAGKKTVYVQYKDRAANVSAASSDSISYRP